MRREILVRSAAMFLLVASTTVCASSPGEQPEPRQDSRIQGSGPVSVAYAATLVGAFEHHVAPSFEKASGFTFQGEAKGSIALANLIRDHVRTPDVFISADPSVNQSLVGPANGNFVAWWVSFATSELVIAWSPASRFAGEFEQAKAGRRTWESVLSQPNLRFGRTDPEIDPKGYRTVMMFQLEEQRTADPNLSRRILGSATNPAQLFLEEQLVARLQAGELDAGVFFKVEATEAKLPYLSLPREINQGDVSLADQYSHASYTNRRGQERFGTPIVYTLTIPTTVRNRRGALSFAQYLLSPAGQAVLAGQGLGAVRPSVSGDQSAYPPELAASLGPRQ